MAATTQSTDTKHRRAAGIRKAKSSPEHRRKMSEITTNLWADPTFRQKHAGRVSWNKLTEDEKIKKRCPVCNKEFVVVPSHNTRVCCSRRCANKNRTGKIHVNWNPDSIKQSGYKKCIRGIFKNQHTFRSSYELAALVALDQGGCDVIVEPFYVWYEYNGKRRRYFPDMLVNDDTVVEIKPHKMVLHAQNVLKQQALIEYCDLHDLTYELWTERDLQLLTTEETLLLQESGIIVISRKDIKPCYQRKKQ